jgi:hypothetical protein
MPRTWKVPVCTGCGGILGLKGVEAGCSCDPSHAKTGKNIEVAEVVVGEGHQVRLEFEGGIMTAKLICPEDGCNDEGHAGHCNLRDWFDNVCFEEMTEGVVILPVVSVEWTDDEVGPLIRIGEKP